MTKRITIARTAAALAGVMALSAAAPVLAQPAGSYTARSSNGYNYDPCRRDSTQRGTAGALIGGGMGAVIGSNAAARNARTEGALLGGLLGAIAGGVVGNKTAACTSGAAGAYAPPPPPYAGYRDDGRDTYADDDDAAQARDEAYAAAEARRERESAPRRASGSDDCTLAESPIHMPDGRIQTRFVRVCRDASGRYAVVD